VLYQDLIKVTMHTLGYLEQAKMILTVTGNATVQLEAWHAEVAHYLPLIKQVIDQRQRRVLQGEVYRQVRRSSATPRSSQTERLRPVGT